jgi:hypothetical protein
MKKVFFIFILMLPITFFVSGTSFAASDWTGNINFSMGAKALDEDDWEPLDSQPECGFNVDFGKKSWPFNVAIGVLTSSKEKDYYGARIKGATKEFRAGIIKIWNATPTMRPYLGGGLALVNAEVKASADFEVSNSDKKLGSYINGGVYWTIAKHFNLGCDLGYSKAKVNLYGIDGEAGGAHASFLIGYHW